MSKNVNEAFIFFNVYRVSVSHVYEKCIQKIYNVHEKVDHTFRIFQSSIWINNKQGFEMSIKHLKNVKCVQKKYWPYI